MLSFDQFSRLLTRSVMMFPATMETILLDLGEQIKSEAESKFGNYQEAVGPFNAWAPLAPSTIAKHGDTPLVDSGEYSESVEGPIVHDFSVEVGSNSEYGVYQEFGFFNVAAGKSVPPRPVFGPSGYSVVAENLPVIAEAVAIGLFRGGRITKTVKVKL